MALEFMGNYLRANDERNASTLFIRFSLDVIGVSVVCLG